MTKLISTIHEAKTNLSRLLRQVELGDRVVIYRNKTPVAELVPPQKAAAENRQFGFLQDIMVFDQELFDSLTDEDLPGLGL